MCRVGGVLYDAGSSVSASADVDVGEWWKALEKDDKKIKICLLITNLKH